MKLIAQNKKASFEYFIEETFECGIVLKGTEIKSIRMGKVNIQDSYARVKDGEAFIINMSIAKYDQGNIFNHHETRERKLLLHKKQIVKIQGYVERDGLTLIPLKVYMNQGLCKIELGVCKGKKLYDKRESLKEADMKRRTEKILKNYGK